MLYNVVLVPDMQQHKSVLTIHIHVYPLPLGGFPVAAAVKNLPASEEKQEMRAGSLGGEDPLEEEMAATSSALAWRSPGTEGPGELQAHKE